MAVICVVILHCWTEAGEPAFSLSGLLARLNIGVTIFFLLSGFLLYRPFIAHRGGGPPPPGFRDYGRRRVLRILPAYWLVLTAVILIPNVNATDGSILSQYAFTYTIDGANGHLCATCGLGQTWSLAVEVSFYLLLPLIVLATSSLWRGSRRAWPGSELVFLALFALGGIAINAIFDPGPSQLISGTAISYAYWFGLGMVLAVASVALESGAAPLIRAALRAHAGMSWIAAAVIFIALCVWLPPTTLLFDTSDRLTASIIFGLVSLLLLLPAVFSTGFGSQIAYSTIRSSPGSG